MTKSTLASILRLSFAVALLGATGWFGYAHRHPSIIVQLGLAFTILYIAGKWYNWRQLWAMSGLGGWLKALASTIPTQLILAGLVYIIGLGFGRLFANQALASEITQNDLKIILIGTVIGLIVTLIINKLEGGKGPLHAMSQSLQAEIDKALEDAPARDED